jgi:hypothetical protein
MLVLILVNIIFIFFLKFLNEIYLGCDKFRIIDEQVVFNQQKKVTGKNIKVTINNQQAE